MSTPRTIPNLAVQGLGSTESVTDTFTYEIIDSDGDSRTATLVITINGSDDPITIGGTGDGAVAGTDATVLESDLVSGSNAAGTGESLSGAFTIAVPDGLQSITVGGTNISAAALNNSSATPVTIPSPTYGTIVINGYNSTSGEVSYTYTLDTFADHLSVDRDTIALTVTDDDGQTQNGTLSIAIGDDRQWRLTTVRPGKRPSPRRQLRSSQMMQPVIRPVSMRPPLLSLRTRRERRSASTGKR